MPLLGTKTYIMNTIAKQFEKDGQTVWTSKSGDVISTCIEANIESLDLATGFIRDEKLLFWVKAPKEDLATRTATQIITNLNTGKLAICRVFSETPFTTQDTMDINPTTGASMNRYSQVRLCPVAKFDELHRQYVTVPVVAPVKNEPINV